MIDRGPSKRELQVSNHYKSIAGARYVDMRQRDHSHIGYTLDFKYFKPFLKSTDCVLDFGCGNGGMLRLIAQHVRRAEGVEVNATAAEIARSSGLMVHSSLETLPAGVVYDVVVSNHVLEHIRDVPSTLEQIKKLIRNEGLILLKVPMEDWRSADSKVWSTNDIDHHLQTWTPKLMGNLMYESGFDVQDIRIITSAWHPKLFPLVKLGLGPIAFWALSVARRRRQLFVIAKSDVIRDRQ
jgi:2-polyprenyl-3-methyl-5-hydroxy-6-metoxy-1,4-benzoquinol methylase